MTDPTPTKALPAIPKSEEAKDPNENTAAYLARFAGFAKELEKEADRAAVILGAANLDELLYQLLSAAMVPTTSASDELLDGDSPLSTFSARIYVSYRLNLISVDVVRALHLIRKIRNSFAHELSGCTLESGAHADRVRQLVAPLLHFKQFEIFRASAGDQHKGPSADFRAAVALLSLRLEGAGERAKRIEGECVPLIPPFWMATEKNLGSADD